MRVSQHSRGCQTKLQWWDGCKSELGSQVSGSGSGLDQRGTWPGTGRDPRQGPRARAGDWKQLPSKAGATIPLLTVLSHGSLSSAVWTQIIQLHRVCVDSRTDRQIPWSRGMGLHSGYWEMSASFSTSVFVTFFILISFYGWNVWESRWAVSCLAFHPELRFL